MKEKVICATVALVVAAIVGYGGYRSTTREIDKQIEIAVEPPCCVRDLNDYREAMAVRRLVEDERLDREALQTAWNNARRDRLFHYPGNEIIAFNYDGFADALDQWDASRVGHHEMLFSPKFHKVGCACVRRGDKYYCCARFE